VDPSDSKGKLVINESDFDPEVHEMFDPLKAQSAKAKQANKAKPKAEPEAKPKPAAKKPAKRAAKKVGG
jgi:hypothetical protein